ncbi:DUF2945 domain-containing protein [Kocuria sediminis]|uniref:DUF2945 domain-containing protein n=1 Tax=Kocuria sediminis TaxID=1038857 RepID=A0A6N8GTV2_9MICC|nr:DUF2945 domain-containing protein [Kocuria sediminis]MUN64743.1 DUF2945 domain-containing protein [Kocuria sediminis]
MSLTKGTKVTWNTPQGTTEGTVVEKKTEDFELDGHTFRASSDDPRYIVESASSGARAAHKPDALTEA